MKQKFSENMRIVWALTSKDLIDGLKNKNVISLIVISLLVAILYRYLPALEDSGPPGLLVYDEGDSALVEELWDSPAVKFYTYESAEDMRYYLTNGDTPELGLILPQDFDQSVAEGSLPELQGYALEVFNDGKILELKRYMEDELESLLALPVTVAIERIPLVPESHGITIMTSMGFVFVSLMVGMMVIPHMMIEERQENTIDVLMVSPAGSAHIIAAKALTGLIYSALVLLIALAFNWSLIQHSWLFLLSGLLGALFSTAIGILLGVKIENRQQLMLWSWAALIPLFLPMLLSLMDDLFPDWAIQIMRYVPSSAMLRIFRTSMASTAPAAYFVPQSIVIIASAALFLLIDIWLIRQLDR